jgi:hypothetical protein
MFSWVYTGQTVFAALFMSLFMGCITVQSSGKSATRSGAAKDCPTCHRMCELAGNTEQNPEAVSRCKAECDQSCK